MENPSASHHNASAQTNVAPNPDPALDTAREHHHSHLHHSSRAAAQIHDDAVYTTGTSPDKSAIPDQKGMRVDDAEKGSLSSPPADDGGDGADQRGGGTWTSWYRRFKPAVHAFIFCLFTGWWIASLILHRNDKNWLIPFLLWLCIVIRLVTFYVPVSYVTRPMHWVWNQTGVRIAGLIPERLRIPAGAALTIAVIIVGTFASAETEDNKRVDRVVSLVGLLVFIGVFYLTSNNRKLINWHTVIVGMLLQFIIALFVLRTQAGYDIFNFVSTLARELLGFARDGVAFLTTDEIAANTYFFFSVLPAIVFFISVVSLLLYFNILQWAVRKVAVFFFWAMRVSGAEAVVAAASPFIGQGESAMLIKPFVAHLTIAEMHQVMTSGFATIAGSVLVAYIGMGINGAALISSCVMSIPASLAISKLRWPETEETLTSGRVVIPDDDEHRAANALHAFANGAWLGLKIAGMIMATLLCIIGFVALVNGLLGWWGRYLNINDPPLSLELILGYCCYPVSFLLGVSRKGDDIFRVAQLIGIKVIQNEFVAYTYLREKPEYQNLSPRSRLIATYALCGFGNLGSLGTQIGVLSQISPARSGDVSKIALSALVSGIIATLSSANVAGLVVTDQQAFD